MFGMGWETLSEVWDGCGHPLGGSRWVGGPTWRLWTVRETLGEVRDGLGDTRGNRDGLENPRVGPGQVWGTSGRSGMGQGPWERSGTVRRTLGGL